MRGIRFLSMLILACIISVSVAYAYEFLYSYEGNYLRWSPDDIPVDYKISTWWLPDAEEPVGAIYAAFTTWEDVESASVSFNYQGTTTDEHTPVDPDDENVIGWNADAYGYEYYTYAFGVAFIMWYDTETFQIDESDIILNIYWQWTTTGGTNKYDIQGIMTHEIGHLLGLDHTDWEVEYGLMDAVDFTQTYPERAAATMISGPTFYATHTASDEVLMRTLEQDDIDGISILYPLDYVSDVTGGGAAGGGCFIASALYGSNMASEVRVLSDYRDRYLLSNEFGRKFVEVYYRVSPPVARFIEKQPVLRKLVRIQITPFVKVVAGLMNQTPTVTR